MADGSVKIDLVVEGKRELKEFNEGMKDWRNSLRLLELEFKQGKKSGGEYQIMAGQLGNALQAFEDGSGRTATAQNALWHANNRVTLGFKSLATEITSINHKMNPVEDQLRGFYREQRVQNRTFRETTAAVTGLSSAFGAEGLGGTLGQSFAIFDQAEFGIHGLGIAAQNSSGKVAVLGSAIMGLAAELTALAAIGIGEIFLFKNLIDGLEESKKKLDELNGVIEQSKVFKPSFWKDWLSQFSDVMQNSGLQLFGALATANIEAEKMVFLKEQEKKKSDDILKQRKENLESAKLQYELGLSNFASVRAVFEIEIALTKDSMEKLKLQKELKDIAKKDLDTHKEKVVTFAQQIKKLDDIQKMWDKLKKQREEEESAAKLRVGGRGFGGGFEGPSNGYLDRKFRQEHGMEEVDGKKKKTIKETKDELNDFQQAAVNSFNTIGNTIGSSVGQGFVDAFGIGHTLLGQFVNEFLSQIARLATASIFKSILSLIPGVGGLLSAGLSGLTSGGGSGGGDTDPIRHGVNNGGGSPFPNIGGLTTGGNSSGLLGKLDRLADAVGNMKVELKHDMISASVKAGDRSLAASAI